ncbi:MAG: LysE family translocator [Bacteroidota bacterium]
MNYDILLSFALATSALAISPGPDNIYVLAQSISNGKSYGMATVCGLITGCIVHTTLLAFGVSAVIKNNPSIFYGIKIVGALYLLFLAYKVFRSDAKIDINSSGAPKKNLKQLFVQGFFMNVLNPKVTLFFLAFFPGFLFSETLSTVVQFYVLGGVFMLVSFIIFSAIALLAARIKDYTLSHKNSGVVFKWLQIVVFVGIAVFILV